MLTKKAIDRIAALTKVTADKLTAAITDEKEVELDIDESIATLSDAELETAKKNEYERGKKTGVEMAVKDVREKEGVDFNGKTLDGLVEAVKKKAVADAKISPDAKVTELEGKVTTLQNTVKDYEAKLTEKDKEVEGVKTMTELYSHIPALGENGPAIGKEDVVQLMRAAGYEWKMEDGKVATYLKGTKVVDKLSNARGAGEVINEFMVAKKLITEEKLPGGRGGSGSGGAGKPKTLGELRKQWKDAGKHEAGEEFQAAVMQARKDDPEFDMTK